jgi:hypothetical protein
VTNALTQIRGAFFSVDDSFGDPPGLRRPSDRGCDIDLELASAPRDDISRPDVAVQSRPCPERGCA